MARIRTTGIVVTTIESKISKEHKDEPDALSFQVVDVGGQRSERKKWMHCFDDVAAILFIVNLAGYNQVMFEDNTKNRMQEELELFNKVTHNPIFADTPIFLFLNKKDLFETMIKDQDMNKVFQDYKGGTNLDPAMTYIQAAFQKQCPPGKSVSVEIVTASYKRDIKCAFENVKSALYNIKRKALLAKVQKIRTQQRQIWQEKMKKQAGCCGSTPPPPKKEERKTGSRGGAGGDDDDV
jgi:GTPase SAR1 family protein